MGLCAIDDLPVLPETIGIDRNLPDISGDDRKMLEHAIRLSGTDNGSRIYSRAALVALALQREAYEREMAQLRGHRFWPRMAGLGGDRAVAAGAVVTLALTSVAVWVVPVDRSLVQPALQSAPAAARVAAGSPRFVPAVTALLDAPSQRGDMGRTVPSPTKAGLTAAPKMVHTDREAPLVSAPPPKAPALEQAVVQRFTRPPQTATLAPPPARALFQPASTQPHDGVGSVLKRSTALAQPTPNPVQRRIDAVDAIKELRAR